MGRRPLGPNQTHVTTDGALEIVLTQGQRAIVDASDGEVVAPFRWCAIRGNSTFYAATKIRGRIVFMHTVLMDRIGVDHVDGNGLNNRRRNLRLASPKQNSHNRRRRRDSSLPYKGIRQEKNGRSFGARIVVGGRRLWLGAFDTPEAAARVYDAAARYYHGAYARPNFCA